MSSALIMSDITLSLGGKWLHETAEREKQGQMIAHLTNQLEGLRVAYSEDLEKVAKHKDVIVKLQDEVDKAEAEREEWKAAYNGIINKRIERDHLVEDMLEQLQTLESTTRNEELRASEATKKATLLEKEKDLAFNKIDKMKKELDEVYSRLAQTNDELATQRETSNSLATNLQGMTRSRDSKEVQVVSLLKEKNRLFRLVTDLRSTIKVAGGAINRSHDATMTASKGAASIGELEDTVSSEVNEARTQRRGSNTPRGETSSTSTSTSTSTTKNRTPVNGVGNMINSTLDGTIDRPKWASSVPSLKLKTSNRPRDITSPAELDKIALDSSMASSFRSSRNGSKPTSPNRARINPDDHDDESENEVDVEDRRSAVAKKNLIMRLKRQIELLEEKNAELEKTIGLVRSENQLLLVRFRGAHDRRTQAEKKLKQVEAELNELKHSANRASNQEEFGYQSSVNFNSQYESAPQYQTAQKQRPITPAVTRWK